MAKIYMKTKRARGVVCVSDQSFCILGEHPRGAMKQNEPNSNFMCIPRERERERKTTTMKCRRFIFPLCFGGGSVDFRRK